MMSTEISSLPKALLSEEFRALSSPLSFILGQDDTGHLVFSDLEQISHLAIAGATGTGKSTFAHSLILSIASRTPPDKVRFLLCDSKFIEFTRYRDLPHLLIPPLTELDKIVGSLQWVETEMRRRTQLFQDMQCRSIADYNDHCWEVFSKELPHIVVVIDDAAVVAQSQDAQEAMQHIAQTGRSLGFHLVLITQSPSARGICNIIKNYIPARASFSTISAADDKILFGTTRNIPFPAIGSMIFYQATASKKDVVHCFNVSDYIISDGIAAAREAFSDADAIIIDPPKTENIFLGSNTAYDTDEMLSAAVDVILETRQASVSMIQRRLKLGYARAARILDEMEEKGIVGPFQGSTPRAILITKEQWAVLQHGDVDDFDDFDVDGIETIDAKVTEHDPLPTSFSAPRKKHWFHSLLGERKTKE